MTMQRTNRRKFVAARGIVLALAIACSTTAVPAYAQDVMQLTVPAPEYTLGRFKYEPPKTDGWRQMANFQDGLSLIYAEQKEEGAIDTRFGVAFEVHEIPAEIKVESASALVDLSRKQMAETRKADLVALSGVEQVGANENLWTYRLLVRSPIPDKPDGYEVYYVALAPDKTQYVVVQCITKEQNYGDQIYFTQFYGSLVSLKYSPPADGAKPADAVKPADPAKPAADAEPAKPAGEAVIPAGEPAKPAGEPAKSDAAAPYGNAPTPPGGH